jgi:hypothetical protein
VNPAAILALISDLYGQVAALTEQNQQLQQQITELQAAGEQPAPKP